jgi:2-hydroxyacyl-CoA lyase 1
VTPPPPIETAGVRDPSQQRTGNGLVADALHQCGITRVIGIAGTPVDKIFPACSAHGIRPIGARHQHAAVLMAAASNYVGGRLESAVVVSAGPAVTNALTGVMVARDNGWPVIVIGGRRPIHDEGIGYFQELDAVPIFRSVTKWAATVQRVSDVVPMVLRAYECAMSGRPGPVYLDLPEDVLNASMAGTDSSSVPGVAAVPPADDESVLKCGRLLVAAQRPLLIVGEDIRWTFSQAALRRLVERNNIPFVTTPLARGFLPDDHPLCANAVRHWIPSRADLVLMTGAWFDWRFRFGAELARSAQVIHVGTDAATLGKNVPGALTVHADGGRFLNQLEEWLQSGGGSRTVGRHDVWVQEVNARATEKAGERTAWGDEPSQPMSPQNVFAELQRFLPKEAIVVLDGSTTLSTGQMLLSAQTPCGWLDPGWSGCMGAGIPMAIGAKLTAPHRLVVVVCGDFGFGLSAMDLETAVRHRIPIVVIVINNDGIVGASRQTSVFPPEYAELFSRYQPALRYERIAGVLGCDEQFVTDVAGIRPAFERAAASPLPACINIRVDPDAPHPGPW